MHYRCGIGKDERKVVRMPRIKDKKFVTFNDGILDICKINNREIVDIKHSEIRYGYRTVGMKRFYEAKVMSDKIDEMVAILPTAEISTLDICIIRGIQYKIVQIQNKYDASPAYMLLSLERSVIQYKDMRENGKN